MVEDKCDVSGMGELDSADKEALSRRTREILHQCYKFGFEVSSITFFHSKWSHCSNSCSFIKPLKMDLCVSLILSIALPVSQRD